MNLEKLTQYLDTLPSRGVPSVDCIIYDNHKQVYRHMCGTTDDKHTVPVNGKELYLMFSMTKVQTMTAVMQLIEQGKLSLEDKVSEYLPVYKNITVNRNGETEVVTDTLLVKHLLSMQSGLNYDLKRPGILRVLNEKGQKATTRELVDAFVESPFEFAPGEHFLYSLSHDVAAAIIDVVSGMTFGEYLKKNIWEPLGMKHTFFGKPMNSVDGLVQQFIIDEFGKTVPMEPSCDYQLSEAYESGGAGLISCTEDYAVFADTLACGGISAEGVRILKPETIDLMKTNLLSEKSIFDLQTGMGRTGYGYGCGVQILLEPEKIGTKAPAGVFGWDGAAGSCIIMDKASGLSLVYTQHVRNCGFSYGEIHHKLRDYLFE